MIKSKRIITVLLSLLLLFCFSAFAMAEDIKVQVNGVLLKTDVPPVIIDNRTLVPMRAIGETLGAVVDYKSENQSVSINKDSISIILYLNSNKAVINGEEKILDVPPTVIRERTMLPLRFMGESLNCSVNWLAESNTVTVTSSALPAQEIADRLLNIINEKRTTMGLKPLLAVPPLQKMATAQAASMALQNKLTSLSMNNEDTAQRAARLGLANVTELLSQGNFDAESVWNQWISNAEYKAVLLDEELRFLGISAFYAPAHGADDLYVCLDLLKGGGFFTENREGIAAADGKLTVKGYLYEPQTRVVLYVLNPEKPELYLNRFSVYPEQKADRSFEWQFNLTAGGLYAVYIGNDKIIVNTRVKE